ncbi:hypothetical protein SSIG_04648 [Streptomyces filamentosus NRRL 11379]|nr:hypothetical protein SSIG_04648 [Streptomyces filamentosus NRRL 11379]
MTGCSAGTDEGRGRGRDRGNVSRPRRCAEPKVRGEPRLVARPMTSRLTLYCARPPKNVTPGRADGRPRP